MWLAPENAHLLKGGKKNGFLVSGNPTDHPTHTQQLRSRMPVAEELADEIDEEAKKEDLSDFDLARAAIAARDQGLDPRGALSANLGDEMVEALKKFRDGVFDAAKALKAGGCMRTTTSASRPSKRPRPSSPPGSPSPAPRAAPTAGGGRKKPGRKPSAGQQAMESWGRNASLAAQNAHLRLLDEG